MAEIPKIVRGRLPAGDAGSHPDADLLTAFAEQGLSRRERDALLTHLAQCADCREVVTLAAPRTESIIAQPAAGSRWLAWPALRWGALAACGVIVAVAVSLRPRPPQIAHSIGRDESPQVAMKQSQRLEEKLAAPAPDGLDKDRVAMNSITRVDVAKPKEKALVARRTSAEALPEARAKAVSPAGNPPAQMKANSLAFAGGNLTRAQNEPTASVVSEMATATPAAPPAPAHDLAGASADAKTEPTDTAQLSLGKAKEALDSNAGLFSQKRSSKVEAMAAPQANMAPFPLKKVMPRWTLSADGTLQRSLDSGKSWKIIPVSADATFTAVAALDSNIWVGGTHGALYHSIDAGEHWTQVVPSKDGQPLTSNIIGIEFTDTLHGKISTSNQETWTTSDGGQSWQAQD